MLEMSEIWPPIFCGPLKCRVHCRPPSALHPPRSNSAVSDFRAMWPIVTPAKVLNQASPCRTLMEPLCVQPSNVKITLQAISARTSLLNTPFFQLLIKTGDNQTGGNDICVEIRNTAAMLRTDTAVLASDYPHNVVVAFVWQYGCRSGSAERHCTGNQMGISIFPLPPFEPARLQYF